MAVADLHRGSSSGWNVIVCVDGMHGAQRFDEGLICVWAGDVLRREVDIDVEAVCAERRIGLVVGRKPLPCFVLPAFVQLPRALGVGAGLIADGLATLRLEIGHEKRLEARLRIRHGTPP